MREILNIRMLSMRAAWTVVLGMCIVLTSAAQAQNSEHKTLASSATQPTQKANNSATEPSTAANEEKSIRAKGDIHVHGHWVIDVRNPDGTLASHREFENSYLGGNNLATFVARLSSVGLWEVGMSSNSQAYNLYEPLENRQPSGMVSGNLALSVISQAFVINGSFTAAASDTVQIVETLAELCSPSIAPASPCVNVPYQVFTQATLNPQISFVAGQIVQVTVTITFS
jgi:hypothetical protein